MPKKLPGSKDIPAAGVTWKSATEYKTGDWRSKKPVRDKEKCTRCLICWIFCPDAAITWDGKDINFDLDFCKGCGICAAECPVDCIEMEEE
jgi:pyruvate ferredoxin oxidoreductase delta subunit